MKPQALLFDLDGTLFQTEDLLLPAYHRTFDTLRQEGLFEGETPPDERILSGLGMLLDQIWQMVVPGSGSELRTRANDLLLQYQLEDLEAGGGRMYDGVEETLAELHAAGYRLFVASNGLEAYVKGVIKAKGLEPLFEGLYSAGEYQTTSKVDLVRILLDNHGLETAWMVGDRSSDVEAGKKNGLPVVGCDYADFKNPHELDDADMKLRRFSELTGLLKTAAEA